MLNENKEPVKEASGALSETPCAFGSDAWRQLLSRRATRFCLLVILLFSLIAAYGEIVYRYYKWRDVTPFYNRVDLSQRYMPPSFLRLSCAAGGGDACCFSGIVRSLLAHPLGTDNLGRDVLQRIIQGARIAFQVGIVTSLIALPLGTLLGCLGGYFGGKTDAAVVWLYSTVASMPGLLFVLSIAVIAGKGLLGIYLGIGLTTWVGVCRLVRAEVIKHKNRAYVQAARVMGFGHIRILFRHVLPNVAHIIIIVFSIRFPAAIATEIFISFLGIGVQNEPSWGIMINNARLRLWQGVWWEMSFVSLAIFAIVLSFNLLGDALRDAFDPRLRTEHS